MRKWKGPQIPRSLLHSMYEVHTEGGGYDKEQGGQWKPGTTVETAFQGGFINFAVSCFQFFNAGFYFFQFGFPLSFFGLFFFHLLPGKLVFGNGLFF